MLTYTKLKLQERFSKCFSKRPNVFLVLKFYEPVLTGGLNFKRSVFFQNDLLIWNFNTLPLSLPKYQYICNMRGNMRYRSYLRGTLVRRLHFVWSECKTMRKYGKPNFKNPVSEMSFKLRKYLKSFSHFMAAFAHCLNIRTNLF